MLYRDTPTNLSMGSSSLHILSKVLDKVTLDKAFVEVPAPSSSDPDRTRTVAQYMATCRTTGAVKKITIGGFSHSSPYSTGWLRNLIEGMDFEDLDQLFDNHEHDSCSYRLTQEALEQPLALFHTALRKAGDSPSTTLWYRLIADGSDAMRALIAITMRQTLKHLIIERNHAKRFLSYKGVATKTHEALLKLFDAICYFSSVRLSEIKLSAPYVTLVEDCGDDERASFKRALNSLVREIHDFGTDSKTAAYYQMYYFSLHSMTMDVWEVGMMGWLEPVESSQVKHWLLLRVVAQLSKKTKLTEAGQARLTESLELLKSYPVEAEYTVGPVASAQQK